MGLTIFYKIFLTFSLNDDILCRIMSVPKNIVMDLNNVMNFVSYKSKMELFNTCKLIHKKGH